MTWGCTQWAFRALQASQGSQLRLRSPIARELGRLEEIFLEDTFCYGYLEES
jgi:hypothetical protein